MSPPRGRGTPEPRTRSASSGGRRARCVFGLDALKGALAAAIGLAVDGHRGAYVLGAAAILGHMLPVTRKFKGGRGVATAGGVMLVLFPLLTLAMTTLWVVLAKLTHKASIASVTVAIACPISVALAGHEWGDVAVITVLALLVVGRHLSNLRRLVKGEELGLETHEPREPPDDVGDERAAS